MCVELSAGELCLSTVVGTQVVTPEVGTSDGGHARPPLQKQTLLLF